jgi:glutamyl-tRNA synthetase
MMDDSLAAPPVGRLAPSPTGLIHVGNARSLLLAWLSVRSRGGRIFLRIEDLLPGEEHEEALLRDLEWLGLDWDPAPDVSGLVRPGGVSFVRQSARGPVYSAVLSRLSSVGRVYPCVCTRKDIEAAARAPHAEEQGLAYPGTCRARFAGEAAAVSYDASQAALAGRAPFGVALRLRVPEAPVSFHDALCGGRAVHLPDHSGDIVVRRKDGGFAYMLAVVVDDLAMGVTEVVRGDDLLDATAQQLAVYGALAEAAPGGHADDAALTPELEALWARAAGWLGPSWVHVPLVLGDDGRRLAKRNRSIHLGNLREAGVSAEAMRRWLARSLGLPDTPHLDELAASFRWEALPPGPVVFGERELEELRVPGVRPSA